MKNTCVQCSTVRIAFATVIVASLLVSTGYQLGGGEVRIDSDDLGGVVTSNKGPEAGVWVIAETTDLPTKFVKIVVTDDRGRYVLPDLPGANYKVRVRGYGLLDSEPVRTSPGKTVNLKANVAPNPRAAAEYYPANFWYSLLRVPDKRDFPGTGPKGNGISENVKSQSQWLQMVKTDGCVACHQMGNKAIREIPNNLGHFESSLEAWERRMQSGQAGPIMQVRLGQFGRERALALFADWTDRIKAGEYPQEAPPRPQGVERNVVITEWDWADPKAYLHDEIATDKRNPTVNAYGPLYGSLENSADYMPVLDPVRHTASRVKVPVRDPKTSIVAPERPLQPSSYWGEEAIWTSRANGHSNMLDHLGRVWLTTRIRPSSNPAFCKTGSSHPSAKLFPVDSATRQLGVYDPKSQQFTLIDTCFTTHHLQFAEDANYTMWTSAGGTENSEVIGWLNTKTFDETRDEAKSQGWAPFILDTNGNGKQDKWVEPDQPIDPAKDKRISTAIYGVAISPVDGSVWGSVLARDKGFPGSIVRVSPGSNPPATTLTEIYEPPFNNPGTPVQGYAPRGMDIDRNGVVWVVLASGHFASFDRRKCKRPLNGPTAIGQHCPEGWSLFQFPGPQFKGITEPGSTEASYYPWVDQFDTFGLGKNVPIATGNESDSLLALVGGKFVVLRVPYPMGFYAKGLDGRIDDPKAGWKGKGLWSTYATRAPFHTEGGKGTTSKVVHFQLRPDPLAK